DRGVAAAVQDQCRLSAEQARTVHALADRIIGAGSGRGVPTIADHEARRYQWGCARQSSTTGKGDRRVLTEAAALAIIGRLMIVWWVGLCYLSARQPASEDGHGTSHTSHSGACIAFTGLAPRLCRSRPGDGGERHEHHQRARRQRGGTASAATVDA